MVKFHGYRKNRQWVVTWRSTTGSVLSQGFDSEQDAPAFENSLLLIAEKERALLLGQTSLLEYDVDSIVPVDDVEPSAK